MSCIKAIIKVRIYNILYKKRTLLQQNTWKLLMFMERKITYRQQLRSQLANKRQLLFYPILKKPSVPEDWKGQKSAISRLQ